MSAVQVSTYGESWAPSTACCKCISHSEHVTDLTKDDARDFITEKFGAEPLAGISNSVWKSRLEALTAIQEGLGALDLKADGAKVCLALCHIPGWLSLIHI